MPTYCVHQYTTGCDPVAHNHVSAQRPSFMHTQGHMCYGINAVIARLKGSESFLVRPMHATHNCSHISMKSVMRWVRAWSTNAVTRVSRTRRR